MTFSKQALFLDCVRAWTRFRLSTVARVALAMCSLVGVVSLVPTRAGGNESRDTWYFSAKEIHAAYQYQENFGARIRNPVKAQECFLGRPDFVASYRSLDFVAPCRFITESTRHLKEMLNAGAAKYFFPLDANHAHLGIPVTAWEGKYRHLPNEQILPALLDDPALVALYHTAEHLDIRAATSADGKKWLEQRNVLGFFDGRPIEILPPKPRHQGVGMPEKYHSYGGFDFLASRAGALFVFSGNRMITFDVSLDPDAFDNPGLSRSDGDVSMAVRISRSGAQRASSWEGR